MTKRSQEPRKKGRPRKKLDDKLSKVLTTDKQKAFLRNRLAGMNKRQAAIQAGYAPSTASIMATRLTDRLSCNRFFIEEAQRQGLTIEAIIGEIKRGMSQAMHPQHPDQPDNFNRRAYTDMAVKIYGGYAPSKLDIRKDSRELHVEMTIEEIRAIEEDTGEKLLDENEKPIPNEKKENDQDEEDSDDWYPV
ncbi:MAG: terminase small subunit [Candidatus Hodarchaeota archaeon]